MKLIKYLFRKFILPIYVIISSILALIFTLATAGKFPLFLQMLPIILCLLLTLRASDDVFDYENDLLTKKQYLNKLELTIFACLTAAVFVLLNFMYYGIKGLVSIAALGYILLQEKFPLLKTSYMALLFAFYFYVNCSSLNTIHLAVTVACFAASTVYYIFKRKVRK